MNEWWELYESDPATFIANTMSRPFSSTSISATNHSIRPTRIEDIRDAIGKIKAASPFNQEDNMQPTLKELNAHIASLEKSGTARSRIYAIIDEFLRENTRTVELREIATLTLAFEDGSYKKHPASPAAFRVMGARPGKRGLIFVMVPAGINQHRHRVEVSVQSDLDKLDGFAALIPEIMGYIDGRLDERRKIDEEDDDEMKEWFNNNPMVGAF